MKNSKLYQAISSTRWGKSVLVALGTIFLGALGSGLWDVFLRDVLNLLGLSLLRLIGFVYSGYLDSLHASIARGTVDRFTRLPYFLIVVLTCMFPWYSIRLLRRRVQSLEAKYATPSQPRESITADDMVADFKRTVRRFMIVVSVTSIFVTTAYLAFAARDVYATGAAIYLDRSIEIVAPHTSPTTVLRLRAAFRAIRTTADFHKLDSELKDIAGKAQVELPKFGSLGR